MVSSQMASVPSATALPHARRKREVRSNVAKARTYHSTPTMVVVDKDRQMVRSTTVSTGNDQRLPWTATSTSFACLDQSDSDRASAPTCRTVALNGSEGNSLRSP